MAGWIKLYRSIEANSVINDDEPYDKRSAWVWLLLHANTEPHKITFHNGTVKTIKRGQLHTSIRHLAKVWGWGNHRVMVFLENLQNNKMIRVFSNTNGTLITIEKYKSYQSQPNTYGNDFDNDYGNDFDTRYKKKEEYSNSEPTSVGVPVAASDNNDPRYRKLELGEPDVL